MEQTQEENIMYIGIRLDKELVRVIDLILESDRNKYVSRERTIEHLIKKGMHQTF